MVVVLFRSRLREDCPPSYAPLAERMLALAQSMPGFLSFRRYRADDGERISVIEFASEEQVRAWHDHPEHLLAQQQGREEFYASYRLQVCTLARVSEFARSG